MRFLLTALVFIISATPVLAGNVERNMEQRGQYWQRVHASSALYLRGPKAQQMLNRDIARCVVELRELERLGAVKDAIPEYAQGIVMGADEAEMKGWDTPIRDEQLYAEHSDYIDFEGCMLANGWQRIKYVPYDVAEQAQENYKKTHYDYRTKKDNKASNSSQRYRYND